MTAPPVALSLAVIGFGAFGIFVLFLVLIGKFSPASGSELLGFDPEGSAARRAAAEAEDEEQMLELQNRQRREAGLPELSFDELATQVHRDIGDPRFPPP
jgi:hypothetical protein